MYYNNDVELFLEEIKKFLKGNVQLKQSSINIYLGRIKKILENGYTVSDLCCGIDRLLEDYSLGGKNYDKHNNTKSALTQVRKMIKGDLISSLYVSYEKGSCVWSRIDQHVTEYCIKDEKITFSLNTNKKYVKKISPVNIGKLIYILQDAERQGFLCDQYLSHFTKSFSPVFDAPSPATYEYTIGDNSGVCFGSLLIDSKDPKRSFLQNQYDNLINQIIDPYNL